MRQVVIVAVLSLPAVAHADDLQVGPGLPYTTIQSAIDDAMPGDSVLVHGGEYTEDLELSTSGGEAERLALVGVDGMAVVRGAVLIDGSSWDVQGLTFVVPPGVDGFRVRGNDNHLIDLDLSGGDRDGIDGSGIDNEVRGSRIHDFDGGDADAHCIVLNPGAFGWRIHDNDLFDCSGDGVQLYAAGAERTIHETEISDNRIWWSGGIGRMENAIDVKNADGLVVFRNTAWGFIENKTMVFQKGPADIIVQCNVLSDGFTGVEFRAEDGGTVENVGFDHNLLRGFTEYALKFDGTVFANVVHNTFVDITSDGLRIEGLGLEGGTTRNNIWLRTGAIDGGAFEADHNGFFEVGSIGIASRTDVLADPLLDGAFQLLPGSPMIDAGGEVGIDFTGVAPDLGWAEVGLEGCGLPAGGGGAGGGDAGTGGAAPAGPVGPGAGSGGESGDGGASGDGTSDGAAPGSNGTGLVGSGDGAGGGEDAVEDGEDGCAAGGGGASGGGAALLVLAVAALRRRRAQISPPRSALAPADSCAKEGGAGVAGPRMMIDGNRRLRLPILASMIALGAACADDPSLTGVGGGSGGGSAVGSDTTGAGPGEGGGTTTGSGTVGGDPAEDAAEVVSSSLPDAMSCGEVLEATVVMRNTGTRRWTRADGDKLGGVDDSDPLHPGEARIWLDEGVTVAPGDTHTFRVALTAPGEVGSYLTDWQMVHENVGWFGEIAEADVTVACGPIEKRTGPVALDGSSLIDDQGRFNALGATMMWAAWAYKFDRPKLEANLDYLARHGFHYIRALGVVGDYDEPDYWDGREIDWRWEDYPEVIAGLTDLAFDTYGLRIEWTLIGDGQINIPESADRQALVDTFLEMAGPRAEKIMHFEIANEAWQNGFAGDEGLEQLRALTLYMNERTDILVAASAPPTAACDEVAAIYDGGVADIATVHFDREVGTVEGHWRPVRMPWDHAACNMPVGSNNEPIGPGASVAAEDDPVRLVAGAIVTHLSGLPLHVFHSHAGVRGDEEIFDEPGAGDFVHLAQIVPGDVASWTRQDATSPDSPFRVYAQEGGVLYPDAMWTDLAAPENGALRAFGAVRGADFFVFPIAILGKVVLEPRRAMVFDVIDPMTGAILATHTRAAGETVEISGSEALVLRGTFQ